MFVYKRMTKKVVSISPDVSILDAMEVMRVSQVRRLPVVEGEILVGIVTDRDLNSAAPSIASTLSKYEANYLLTKMKISEIMTKKLFTITPNATIEEVALIMYKNKIGGVPVVEEGSNKLAGIITETDIFKILVDVMGLPKGTTRVTICVVDLKGILAEIGTIFKELDLNISSLAILDGDKPGEKEMVIRGEFGDTEVIKKALEEKAFKVIDITKII